MAKLLLDIPDEFIKNYKKDKFNDAINRVKYDIKDYREMNKGYGLSGNYEDEVLDMFIEAFEKSRLLNNLSKGKTLQEVFPNEPFFNDILLEVMHYGNYKQVVSNWWNSPYFNSDNKDKELEEKEGDIER